MTPKLRAKKSDAKSAAFSKGNREGGKDGKRAKAASGGAGASKYNLYLYKLLKQVRVNPSTGISKSGMAVMDSFVHYLERRICEKARSVMEHGKNTRTMNTKTLKGAVKLLFSSTLAEEAVATADRAVAEFRKAEQAP